MYSKSLTLIYFNLLRRTLLLLLVMTVLASSLAFVPRPVQAQGLNQSVTCASYHIVKRGETLYKIGLKYGLLWTTIAKANGISNPARIKAGDVLCIPQVSGGSGSVKYVQAIVDINIRSGPGKSYAKIGLLRAGQIAAVTGKSADSKWWRVICPNGKTGECYVSASSNHTQVYNGTPPSSGVPTFDILAVERNKSVTIRTANFPKKADFVVRMGLYGTKGVGGEVVATFNSRKSGEQTLTFPIPVSLYDQKRIAIRLEASSGYYAYNWFWNKSTP